MVLAIHRLHHLPRCQFHMITVVKSFLSLCSGCAHQHGIIGQRLLMRQELQIVRARISKGLAGTVVAMFRKHHKRTEFFCVIKHVLSENKIQHEYFDCAALYAQDGSLFTEAVRSISRHSKRGATLDGSDNGAILVLDHLECMFPPLTSHTQVPILVICGFLPV